MKISIDKVDNTMYSDIYITNDFKRKINGSFQLNYSKMLTYNLSLKYDQLTGLNDYLQINTMLLAKDRYINLAYKLNHPKFDILTQYKFNMSIPNNDVRKYTNEFSLQLMNNRFSIVSDKQNIRDINVTDNMFYEYEYTNQYIKNFNKFNIVLSPAFSFNIANIKNYNKKEYILTQSLDIDLLSKFYDMKLAMFYYKNLSSNILYDKYSKSMNIYGFDKVPLNIDNTDKLIYMNNKVKYPFSFGYVFSELAIGTDFNNIVYGTSIGVSMKYKNYDMNLKYCIDKNKLSSVNLKLAVQF